MRNGRRLKLLTISAEHQAGKHELMRIIQSLPNDARLVGAGFDHLTCEVFLAIHSDSYEEIAPNTYAPRIDQQALPSAQSALLASVKRLLKPIG